MKVVKIFSKALISIIGLIEINSLDFSKNIDINTKIEPVKKNVTVDNSNKNERGIYVIELQYYIKKDLIKEDIKKTGFFTEVDKKHKENLYYVYEDAKTNEYSYRSSIYYVFYTKTYKSENEKYDLRVILYIGVKLNTTEPKTTFNFKLQEIDSNGHPIQEIKSSEIEITILQENKKNQNKDEIKKTDISNVNPKEEIKKNEILTDEKTKIVEKNDNIKKENINDSNKEHENDKTNLKINKIELKKNDNIKKDIKKEEITKIEQKENKKEDNNNETKTSQKKEIIISTSNTNTEDKNTQKIIVDKTTDENTEYKIKNSCSKIIEKILKDKLIEKESKNKNININEPENTKTNNNVNSPNKINTSKDSIISNKIINEEINKSENKISLKEINNEIEQNKNTNSINIEKERTEIENNDENIDEKSEIENIKIGIENSKIEMDKNKDILDNNLENNILKTSVIKSDEIKLYDELNDTVEKINEEIQNKNLLNVDENIEQKYLNSDPNINLNENEDEIEKKEETNNNVFDECKNKSIEEINNKIKIVNNEYIKDKISDIINTEENNNTFEYEKDKNKSNNDHIERGNYENCCKTCKCCR